MEQGGHIGAVCGGGGSGKTAACVARAAELLKGAAAPADVLAVAPGVDGALELGRRIELALGEAGGRVRCASMRSIALAVLATPAAKACLGFLPRPMVEVEEALLLADLRAAGFEPAVAKEAWSELCAAWGSGQGLMAAGSCGASGQPVSSAARAALALLRSRGVLPACALAAEALFVLRTDARAGAACAALHVVADDANALGSAAVALLAELARASLLMAGDPSWAPTLFDPAANPRAFVDAADPACVTSLPQPNCMLRAQVARTVKWSGPEAELWGAQAYVRGLFSALPGQAGTTGLGPRENRERDGLANLLERDVCVVVPNKTWAGAVAARLAECRCPSTQLLAKAPLSGDPRRARTNAPLRAFALLGLAARPNDAGLWRLWCALDAPDMACTAWAALERWAVACGLPVAQALAGLDSPAGLRAPADAARLASAYARATGLLETAGRRVGHGLLKATGAAAQGELFDLCQPMEGDEPAEELFDRVVANAVDRHFDADPHKVRIGCPEAFVGASATHVLALGLNDGLAPAGAACACEPAYLHAFGVAREELTLSYLQRCPHEAALRLGASFARCRTVNGVRHASLKPSSLFSALGAEAPSTLSGQQFCSAVLDVRV